MFNWQNKRPRNNVYYNNNNLNFFNTLPMILSIFNVYIIHNGLSIK